MKDIFGAPAARFAAGLLIVPAFLLQDNLYVQGAQALLFVLLSVLSGKRFRLLPNLLIGSGILLMNLLTPQGRVLVSIGSFAVTRGALDRGIAKALVLIGLIYLSRFSVTRGLSLPGRMGGLLSRVFYYFEEITESRGSFSRKNIISRLDELLISVQERGTADGEECAKQACGSPEAPPPSRSERSVPGIVFLAVLAAGNWAALLIR